METVKATKTKKPAGKTRGAGRSRTWAALVYPESAAEGWRETLEELHITGFISPLHDKDVNPDGTPKKAHYHVLLMWEGVKSAEQAKEVWDAIKAVPEPRPVNSARGYARYLCHLDNPEKHQYSPADVVALGGADWEAVTHLPTDDYAAVKEMCQFIRKNKIYSFAAFFDLCMETYDEWANTLIRGGSLALSRSTKGHCTGRHNRAFSGRQKSAGRCRSALTGKTWTRMRQSGKPGCHGLTWIDGLTQIRAKF